MTRPTLPQLRSRLRWLVVTASLAIAFTSANDAQAVWKMSKTLAVTGPGSGNDYLSFDDKTGKLYVPHGSNIVIVDTNAWRQTSSLGGFSGVHGIAVSPDGKFGFAT